MRRVLPLLAGAAVDAAAGLAAAAGTILWQSGSHFQLPALVLACTGAALLAQAVLVPGWVLAAGPADRAILLGRLAAALAGFAISCAASSASAILFLFTDSANLTVIVMPLALAGTAALAVVRAQAADPRVPAGASDGIGRPIAAAGAVGAWLTLGLFWSLGLIEPPTEANDAGVWWGSLIAGPLAVALAGVPARLGAPLTAAGLPPARVLLGGAAASVGALALIAGVLLLWAAAA